MKMIPKFKSAHKQELIHEEIDKDLFIDDQNLNGELLDQALLFKKYIYIKSEVSKKAKITRLVLDEKKAELITKFSNDGTGKKVKEIEAAVTLDADVQRLERELIDSEELLNRYEGIVRAVMQRHEALRELSTNRRKDVID